jgi:hypothetical protein
VKRVLVLLVVLLLVVSAVAACGGDTTSTSDTVDEAATTSTSDSGGDTSGDLSDASSDESDGGGWVEVISMKGSTSKRSSSFTLEGGEQKLEYSMKGDTMPIMAVYVEPSGWDMEKDGGFPAVWPDEAGSDTTMLEKDAGEYIVQVEAANCDWTVTILERR